MTTGSQASGGKTLDIKPRSSPRKGVRQQNDAPGSDDWGDFGASVARPPACPFAASWSVRCGWKKDGSGTDGPTDRRTDRRTDRPAGRPRLLSCKSRGDEPGGEPAPLFLFFVCGGERGGRASRPARVPYRYHPLSHRLSPAGFVTMVTGDDVDSGGTRCCWQHGAYTKVREVTSHLCDPVASPADAFSSRSWTGRPEANPKCSSFISLGLWRSNHTVDCAQRPEACSGPGRFQP